MKLVHPEMDYALLGNENVCMEWIIENPQTFSSYVQEIRQQCNGEEGKFVLSHGDKELNFAKSVELIFDLLSVDCNDKRILTKLYTQLEQLAYGEQFFVQTQELTRQLQSYMMDLEQETEYILNMDQMLNLPATFKALGVSFEVQEVDFFERLIRYMKLVGSILNKKLFIFVNMRSFLSDLQIQMLVEEIKYQDMKMLLIESCARDCIPNLRRCIIDKDNCII